MSVRFKWPPDLAAFRFGSALIWALRDGGISASISGISPLSLVNAIAKPITKLLQHGKVAVSGSTLTCNNGELVAVDDELPIGYKRITSIKFDGDFWYDTNEILTGNDNVTMTLANTSSSGQNVFGSYNKTGTGVKNFSLYVYGGGSSSKSYFRYGEQLLRPQFGSGERTIIFGKDGTSGFLSDVTVTPETFTTVATVYIGMLPNSSSAAYTGSIVGNILVGDRLKYIPCERVSDGVIGYYEMVNEVFLEPVGTGTPVKDDYDTSHCTAVSAQGTPEEIVVSASGVEDQTAHAENLYAVGDIEDTQDIITGTVTRRTEAVVSDGTTPSGRYVGTVGEGNIIIKAREEGYTGEIVSFETEEETPLNGLIVEMEPQQDLHGYDSPWPSGGGKNKFDVDNPTTVGWESVTVGNDKVILTKGYQYPEYVISLPSGDYVMSFTASGITSGNTVFMEAETLDGTFFNKKAKREADGRASSTFSVTDQTSLRIRIYMTTDENVTISGVMIESGTALTTYAPYSNICPISGWTGCEVWRTGKNLLDMRNVQEGNYNKWNIPNLLKPDTVYTFSVRNATHPYGVFLTENHTETGSGSTYQLTNYINNGSITFTTPSNVQDYPWIIIGGGDSQAGHASADLQIELGSTATAYEPFNGNSYSVTFGTLGHNQWDEEWEVGRISSADGTPSSANAIRSKNFISVKPDTQYYWTFSVGNAPTQLRVHFYDRNQNWISSSSGSNIFTTPNNCHFIKFNTGTSFPSVYPSPTNGNISINYPSTFTSYEPYRDQVYGGNYDFIDGKGKDGMNEVNFDDLSWSLVSSTYGRWVATISDIKAPTDGATLLNALAEQYRIVTSNAYNNITGTMYCVPNGTTINVCNGSVTDKPSGKFVYEIATPFDLQREPQPVSTLEGDNNIWSNAGAVTTYVPAGDLIEQVTPQKLNTAEGDNTIIVTAEVEDIVFDVTYRENNPDG